MSEGGGGKSTFLRGLFAAMGSYATVAAAETFLVQYGGASGHQEDVACLAGARMVWVSEVDEGRKFAAALMKRLSGGDLVRASRKGEKSIEFMPIFKAWVLANEAPSIAADDSGVRRRIRRVPWVPIPEAERDTSVRDRIVAVAGSAILAWAVSGCLEWHARGGLGEPPSVLEATRAYFREQDPLEEFFSTCCVFEPGAWVRAGELREAYERFAEEGGSRPVGGRRWTGGLTARGAEVGRNERGRYWMRVRLRSGGEEAAAPDDEQGSAVGCR